jgi:DUF917 family protein
MFTVNYEGIKNLIVGATILGTGGGGDPEAGMHILKDIFDSGKKLQICSLDELDPESYVVTPDLVGSIPAPGAKSQENKEMTVEKMVKAYSFLEESIEEKIVGVVAPEIGGGNTANAFRLGALLGLTLVDCDHCGRSVPEITQSSYHINGCSVTPSVIATANGDLLLIKEYSSIENYEEIARMIAAQTGGIVFVIDSPIRVAIASRVAVIGSISKTIGLGKAVEKAKNERIPTPQVVAEKLGGYVIFKGKIAKYDLREEKGFLSGDIFIEGLSSHRGTKLRIWVKNENIIAWLDGKPAVLPPDLIILLGENGYGVVNSDIAQGMKVDVVAAPAQEILRTPRGLGVIGPRHFGFDLDYVPIEKLFTSNI